MFSCNRTGEFGEKGRDLLLTALVNLVIKLGLTCNGFGEFSDKGLDLLLTEPVNLVMKAITKPPKTPMTNPRPATTRNAATPSKP